METYGEIRIPNCGDEKEEEIILLPFSIPLTRQHHHSSNITAVPCLVNNAKSLLQN